MDRERGVLEHFLRKLREERCLLTVDEFSLEKKEWFGKGSGFDRLQGRFFLEQIIHKYKLQHIKVPRKVAVLPKDVSDITFKFSWWGEIEPRSEPFVKIRAEYVQKVDRTISLEEALEFMTVLVKSGYNDFYGENFRFSQESIYIIDTEYRNFNPSKPQWDAIRTITNVLKSQDVKAFMQAYNVCKEQWDSDACEPRPFANCGGDCEFTFSTSSLLC